MFLNYLLPELELLETGRRNELLEIARLSTAKSSTLFNLLFPICLFLSFALMVMAPLLLIETSWVGEGGIRLYFLVTTSVSSACALTSYHFFRALILAPELRKLLEAMDNHALNAKSAKDVGP